MDVVSSVFGDASLLFALLQRMYRMHALLELHRTVCVCRRVCYAAEAAARSLVLQVFPGATCPPTERWCTHAELISALGLLERSGGGDIRPPLRYALHGGEPGEAPWAATADRVQQAQALAEILVDPHGPASQLLGRHGPMGMLTLQRRLLRRLAFDLGALKWALDLARLANEKARGTKLELDVCLDLADILNLKVSARSFSNDHALEFEVFEEALRATDFASPLSRLAIPALRSPAPSTPRARQVVGRTMASTAQVWLFATFKPEIESRLAGRWGDGEALLHAALLVHEQAVDLAARQVERIVLRLHSRDPPPRVVGPAGPEPAWHHLVERDDEPAQRGFPPTPEFETPLVLEALELGRLGHPELRAPLLELGECVAGLAECWFCIASVARLIRPEEGPRPESQPHDLLDIGAETAANRALETFEDALNIYCNENYSPGHLDQTLEYADALKDYGKVISFFFDENDIHAVKSPLLKSLRLHREFLGPAHPRTANVRRLCAHE